MSQLQHFFKPRSIAIVGASTDLNSLTGQPLKFLLSHGYPGTLYPVNPKYEEILGVRCWPSLASLPEAPDLALLLVGAARVPQMLEECGQRGVAFGIVYGSGYAEVGPEGAAMQAELLTVARKHGMRLLGPNCQGMLSMANRTYAGFGSVLGIDYPAGSVSMVSQSGGFGYCVLNLAALDDDVQFRHVVTTGNEADLGMIDFLEHFVDEPETCLILSYLEGIKDGRRLLDLGARALAQRKPVLVWKAGTTEAGQRAVASHTANLGGAAALYGAAFKQTGIVPVGDLDEFVDYRHAFAAGRLPAGNRVAVVTVSGGAGILASDACAAGGLELPALSPATLDKLKEFFPAFGSMNNPIDVTATIINDWTLVNRTLTTIIDDPGIDAVIMINTSLQGELASRLAREIVAVAQNTAKPLFVTWSARPDVVQDAYETLRAAGIPRYRTPARCGRAMAMLARYAAAVRQHEARAGDRPVDVTRPDVHGRLAGRNTDLAEFEAKEILAAYGVPVTREELVDSTKAAVDAATRIGFPVAMKVQSADIPHKTEAQAVRLHLRDAAQVRDAYDEILRNARAFRPDARIDGVLVQEIVTGGIETIVGVSNDPVFGPAVMFGLGGIFTEVLKDVVFRIAPVTEAMAHDMIREIKGFAVLDGARGAPPADLDALASAIARVSALAVDLRQVVAELDINPLFVMPRGQGVKAADALIRPLAAPGA